MTKPTIVKLWLAGLVVMLVGGAIAGIATLVWLTHVASVTQNGAQYVADNFFWSTVGFWWTAGIVATAGVVIQVAAWIGAVLKTHRLADRTWFNVLLWVGIVGILTSPLFGLGAVIWMGVMIAYMIAGPDVTTAPGALAATPAAPTDHAVADGLIGALEVPGRASAPRCPGTECAQGPRASTDWLGRAGGPMPANFEASIGRET
jgi:hypothetical protein